MGFVLPTPQNQDPVIGNIIPNLSLIICLNVCNSSLKAKICVRNIEFSCSKNAALKAIRSSQRFSPRGRRCKNGENIPPISFNSIKGKSRLLKFCDDELFKYSKAVNDVL
uniref:Uncharacterized protein n=1 Tax=Glossina palpalis gambiensis TaxID=67801 RepID=A0A1B0BYJ0_9MUSC